MKMATAMVAIFLRIDREFREFREFKELRKILSLNSLIYHLNQRTNFLSEGVRLGLSQKKIPSG